MRQLPEILYVRHGRSIENELGKEVNTWIPRHIIGLTRAGYTEARESGQFLADYCKQQGHKRIGVLQSPFLRTVDTGDRIAEVLELNGIDHMVQIAEALTETALQPRDPSGCRPPPGAEEGFLDRYLVDGTVSDLKTRLHTITEDAVQLAEAMGVSVVALVSHQFTSRLHMVSEGLGLKLEDVDKLRPFGNCHVWRLAKGKLEALNPVPELIGTREMGIINPVSYQEVRRKPDMLKKLRMKM
jgi:broad specificity phosphatase PhoE